LESEPNPRGYLREHPIGQIYLALYDVYHSEPDVVQPDLLFSQTPERPRARKTDYTGRSI